MSKIDNYQQLIMQNIMADKIYLIFLIKNIFFCYIFLDNLFKKYD